MFPRGSFPALLLSLWCLLATPPAIAEHFRLRDSNFALKVFLDNSSSPRETSAIENAMNRSVTVLGDILDLEFRSISYIRLDEDTLNSLSLRKMRSRTFDSSKTTIQIFIPNSAGAVALDGTNVSGLAHVVGGAYTSMRPAVSVLYSDDTERLAYRLTHELGHLFGASHHSHGVMAKAEPQEIEAPMAFSAQSKAELQRARRSLRAKKFLPFQSAALSPLSVQFNAERSECVTTFCYLSEITTELREGKLFREVND